MAEAEQDVAGGSGNDIAIIGMAGRFPGASDVRSFWRNLCEGVESISRFPPEALEASPVVPESVRGHPDFVLAAGVLEGDGAFDARFFDVSPREARWMDPQQRVFLECAWSALEDAAQDPERYPGKIALYAGAGPSLHLLGLMGQARSDPASLFELLGTTGENLATKASFKLKLRGESMAVYTACSTGLVAVHMACQSLLLRQSDMALAGAVRLSLPQRTGYLFQEGMILSPDGRCRAFDASARGTVPGNGVATVVLKRLEDAQRDGDHVYAVIRGSALNNDGGLKVGYTAPSVEGQSDAIGEALAYAGLEAGDIGYVEAHGTGTALGDPIEVAALTRAFRRDTDRRGYCGLGSVKTNIGHLDTVAGLAGLMKAALALHHEELPPSLHFEKPNPSIDFEGSPFFVVTERRAWPKGPVPRRAGVSSFGIGGTNAHAVLEEAPEPAVSTATQRRARVVTLSARTPGALETATRALADWLESAPEDVALADVAFTHNLGRRSFEHRRAVVAEDRAKLLARLRAPGKARKVEDLAEAREQRVAFLLPGQGSQTMGMGRELYASEPVFREAVDACLEGWGSSLESGVRALLQLGASGEVTAEEALKDPRHALPALFAVEYGLARLWESWGVTPHALLGHSFGEYVAACLAGVVPLEDALVMVAARGRLMARLPPGSMTAVGCAEEVVRPLLTGAVSLAAVNGPERCVVSGPTTEVEALERVLVARGVGVLRLQSAHAFHSAAVEPLMDEMKQVVAGLRLSAPKRPYISSVTGTWIREEEATDPAYWARQMRAPVRFADGLETLRAEGCTVFLEVGPEQALASAARLALDGQPARVVASLPRAMGKGGEHTTLMAALGALWEQGLEVKWDAVHAGESRRRLSLPTYPFERQDFGVDLPTLAMPEQEKTSTTITPEVGADPTVEALTAGVPSDAAAPRSEVEQRVLAIWRERLGRSDFGVHDDFLELGGNSLMAAQMLTRLREAFPVQLPLSDLFEAPTVAGVSARIQARLDVVAPGTRAVRVPPLVRIPRDGVLPLSVVQERVCELEQALPGNPGLNMPMVLRLSGALDIGLLERSLEAVTRRHEALRTAYPRVDGRTVPRVVPELKLPLTVEPVAGDTREARESEALNLAREEAARPFDLEHGPVVRARLLRIEAEEHLLLVTVHHVVSDTWSMVIFGREVGAFYDAFQRGVSAPLPELPVQYVDYAAWQHKVLAEGIFPEQVTAWRERLVALPGPLDLPVDLPAREGPALSSRRRRVTFAKPLTNAVHALGQREGVTAFMTLLASWQALLARWSGRDDIVVGTPIGNRSRPELEPLIGYVAHAVPLRTDLSGDPTFRELVGRARDVSLEAYANPDIPYEQLIREIEPGKQPGRERVFDALFILHAPFAGHLELPGLRMSLVEVPDGPAQFGAVLSPLSVSMGETGDGFEGWLEYAEERFVPETIDRLIAHWRTLLAAAVADPEQRLSTLPLEPEAAPIAARPERGPETLESIATRMEALASRDAGAGVLTAGDGRTVTWGALRERAEELATVLTSRGVGPGGLVAVCLDPSVERVVALWAVLKAGGAYVLLSPPRLSELASLAPAGGPPPLLLTHDHLQTSVALDRSRVITVPTDSTPRSASGPRAGTLPATPSADARVCLEAARGANGPEPRIVHTHRTVDALFRHLDTLQEPGGAVSRPGTWLAAEGAQASGTDLELLWALTRGLRVVLPREHARFVVTANAAVRRGPDFSLSFFANDEDSLGGRKYRLLLDAARYADAQGFSAIWTPERHFHSFGGLYPRPAVVGAGVATVTERLGIRAGSVVLPLHDPVLVAEEWSVLDNLSDGRVGVSFASGWHANDFVFAPDRYARRKEVMLRGIEDVRSLWRGGTVRRRNGAGEEVEISLRPRPVQKELPFWFTAAGSPETFRLAGEAGAYVLTNLMGQKLEELAAKVSMYREAWRQHGHPGRGHVSLMMHAYLGSDTEEVRRRVREPLTAYFRSSVDITAGFIASLGLDVDPASLTSSDLDVMLKHGVERYLEDGGLFGTPDAAMPMVERVRGLDVDEIACLVDFGVEVDATLDGLRHLAALRSRYAEQPSAAVPVMTLREGAGDASALLTLVREAGVTHLHCTVSMARALSALPEAREVLAGVHSVLLEDASAEAVASLRKALPAGVVVHRDAALGPAAWVRWAARSGADASDGLSRLSLGGRMASGASEDPGITFAMPMEVVDPRGHPVPVGVVGELALAGTGGPRGSWSALVTGRRARRAADGTLELLASVPAPTRRPAPPRTATSTARPSAPAHEAPPPIPRTPRDRPLPLSFAQQRLWYMDRLEPGNVANNNAVALTLSGTLVVEAMERAINEVARRHEVLRTTFATPDAVAVQVIAPELTVPLPLTVMEGAGDEDIQRWTRDEARRPFDLETGPLLRTALLRVGPTEHILSMTLHHIVSDGWSSGVLFLELAQLYGAFLEGRPSPLPELPVQYADYAAWQRDWMRGSALETEQQWWREVLSDVPVLQLSTDRPRPAVQTYAGARHAVQVPRKLAEALSAVGRKEGATPFMVLMAAWQVLLSRYSGQEDFAVGTPVAGRNRPETERLVGVFINSLALRADLSGDPTFSELLGRVRRTSLAAFAHQEVPFEKLVDALHVTRDLAHTPIFQSMLVLHNTPMPEQALAGLAIRSRPVHTATTKLDLTLELFETREGLAGGIEYNTDLFDAETIVRLSGHLLRLLESVAAAPGQRLSTVDLLSAEERHQLLAAWNPSVARESGPEDTVPARFASQAGRTPEAVAVEEGSQRLTFRELDAASERLARHLSALGVKPGDGVALLLTQPLDTVTALLGTMRAGAAAVVLDVDHPPERLSGLLEDTKARVLLTRADHRDRAPGRDGTTVLTLEAVAETSREQEVSEAPRSNHAACIVFTSGSTGRPRGVVLEHRNLVAATRARREVYGAPGVVLSLAPFTFDASLAGLLWSLFEGGTLRYPSPEEREDPRKLAEMMAREQVTHLVSVPALYGQVLAAAAVGSLSGLRAVSVGGEACSLELARAHHEALPSVPLFNEYGPTEATIWSTVHRVRPEEQGSVPIGRAVPGAKVYLLDAKQQLVPRGAPGELYVGGPGVARGYLGQPALTAERFLEDPFEPAGTGARMYRTGDLARWRSEGALEFLGRKDTQVKVRGFRIELGEIEAALQTHPDVKEATVIARSENGAPKRIIAYWVPRSPHPAGEGQGESPESLRSHLSKTLPPYMLPAAFVTLEALPRTRHGKVNTQALPPPEHPASKGPDSARATPRTELEEKLAALWKEVLTVKQVGIHDDFFELGGDSILGLQIITRARAAGIELSPKQLFQNPTIARLAAVAGTRLAVQADQGPVVGPVALTPIQRWFFDLDLEDPNHWNMSLLLEARTPISPSTLTRALAHLLEHHDALRLRYARTGSEWHQASIAPGEAVSVEHLDLSGLSESEQPTELTRRAESLQQSLRLEGPLVRAALLDLGPGRAQRLMFAVHHLAVDAVSWRILLEDLATLLATLDTGGPVRLPPKTSSFQSWARGLDALARTEKLSQERTWWLSRPWEEAARLPVDLPGGLNTEASASTVTVALDAEDTRALLQEVPRAWHTQPQDPLLTALAQVLAAWTGRSAALVDVEGHGREDVLPGVDVSRTVGWFTRVFPALLDLRGTTAPGEALRAIKEGLRAVPSQGMGWGLLRYGARDAALQALPTAEVGFNHLGQVDGAVGADAPFSLAREAAGPQRAASARRPYLLDVTSAVRDGRLEATWTFSEAVHRRATVERLAEDFVARLRTLVAASRAPEAGGHSPSDFPLAKVKQAQLDKLSARFGKKTR